MSVTSAVLGDLRGLTTNGCEVLWLHELSSTITHFPQWASPPIEWWSDEGTQSIRELNRPYFVS